MCITLHNVPLRVALGRIFCAHRSMGGIREEGQFEVRYCEDCGYTEISHEPIPATDMLPHGMPAWESYQGARPQPKVVV